MIKLYSKTESSYKRYYYHLSRNIIICARDMLCSKNFKKFEIFLSLYLTLADEPTGNLDTQNSSEVIALLKEASKKYEQTIIMITHNRSIAQTADRVLQVSDGVLTDFGRCCQ